ncbi:MAG TPA: MBL fold metallo-hydrolase [Archaeoglobaceae archaeon]|nr:MBL fold metallo-hydrolase [Archaeoglobaceae archaeon]
MDTLYILENFGFLPFRRVENGKTRVHLTLRFNIDLHIDSSPGNYGYNLVTHAHTDHYGHCNMKNPNAIASEETVTILEAATSGVFSGKCFEVGEKFEIEGLKIKTYPTEHISGSSAFLIESNSRVLVTGDVKDYSSLPECDVLVTEATYGKPEDLFNEEIDKVISEANESIYGVYPIGKAQRVARILKKEGFSFSAEEKIERICNSLGIGCDEEGDVRLVSPKSLQNIRGKRFILTAQRFYWYPRIVVSDHLDYAGIKNMIEHCNPVHVIFYHGNPSRTLCEEIKEMGIGVTLLKQLERIRV